jgi:hypothetical protein
MKVKIPVFGRDLNPGPLEHEAGVLNHSITFGVKMSILAPALRLCERT